jgi:GNAT superfamily N-acetyltransferase
MIAADSTANNRAFERAVGTRDVKAIGTGTGKISIRRPTVSDVASLAALFSEMQRHYEAPVPAKQAFEAARLACKRASAAFDPRVLIAQMDHVLVGSIVLNVTFPACELTKSLYIRDLYVTKSLRRHGIGRALVRAAAGLAFAEGFSALDWTTATDNAAAHRMYESCGARPVHRTYYRLTPEDMGNKPSPATLRVATLGSEPEGRLSSARRERWTRRDFAAAGLCC